MYACSEWSGVGASGHFAFSVMTASRTIYEQTATILLPNSLTRGRIGRYGSVSESQKAPINRDISQSNDTRTDDR